MGKPIKVIRFVGRTFWFESEFEGEEDLRFCREPMEEFLYRVFGISVVTETLWFSVFKRYRRNCLKVEIDRDSCLCDCRVKVEGRFVQLYSYTSLRLFEMFGTGTFYVGVEYTEA